MKKRFLIILLLLVILATAGYFYVNAVLLPVHLKKLLTEKAESFLERELSFDKISYDFKKGVTVSDINIYEKGSQKEKFVHADEVSFYIFIPNIIKRQKIIINSLAIKNPVVHIANVGQDQWNFSDLLNKKKTVKNNDKPLPSVYLSGLSIDNATVNLLDRSIDPNKSIIVEKADLKANLSLTKGIKYSLKCKLADNASFLVSEGDYSITGKNLVSHITSKNLNLFEFISFFFKDKTFGLSNLFIEDADLAIKYSPKRLSMTGIMKSQINYAINGDKVIQANIESDDLDFYFDEKYIKFDASLLLNNFDGRLGDNKLSSRSLLVKNGSFKKEDHEIKFSGLFDIEDLHFTRKDNLSVQGDLNQAQVSLSANKDDMNFRSSFEAKDTKIILDKSDPAFSDVENNIINAKINLDGEIKNFKNPEIILNAKSKSIDLKILDSIFPQHLKNYRIAPSGQSSVKFDYEARISSLDKAKYNVSAQLINANLDSDRLPERITGVTGFIEYSDDFITWKNIEGTFKGKKYTLDGTFANTLIPSLTTTLLGDDLHVSLDSKIQRNSISLSSLSGTVLSSNFHIKGDVNLPEGTSPDLDIKGNINLDLKDLGTLLPKVSETLEKFRCNGVLSSVFGYKGKINDISRSEIIANSSSKALKFLDYTLDDVSLKFEQGDKPYSRIDLDSFVYDGKLNFISLFDLKNESLPFRSTIQLKDLDLSKLIKDTGLKNKDISGKLSAGLDVSGLFEDQESINGTGTLIIKDGHLLQINLLKGLFKLLVVPDLENIVFTEGTATFQIADRYISTDDLTLISKPVNMNGNGWVDFDKNINFIVTANFNESEMILSDPSLRKGPTAILTQAQEYLNVRITGTLDDPAFKMETLPQRIITDTSGAIKDILIDGVGGIFDGILNP